MTGAGNATVSSTGSQIINPNRTSGLQWADGKPRLWNGEKALQAGATLSSGRYLFASGTLCRLWWDEFKVEMEKNGNGFVSIGDPVTGSCQRGYINTNDPNIPDAGTSFVSGDIIKFRVSDAT